MCVADDQGDLTLRHAKQVLSLGIFLGIMRKVAKKGDGTMTVPLWKGMTGFPRQQEREVSVSFFYYYYYFFFFFDIFFLNFILFFLLFFGGSFEGIRLLSDVFFRLSPQLAHSLQWNRWPTTGANPTPQAPRPQDRAGE